MNKIPPSAPPTPRPHSTKPSKSSAKHLLKQSLQKLQSLYSQFTNPITPSFQNDPTSLPTSLHTSIYLECIECTEKICHCLDLCGGGMRLGFDIGEILGNNFVLGFKIGNVSFLGYSVG